MTKKTTYYILLSWLGGCILLLSSCGKEQEIITSDIFLLPAFDTIRLEAVFDVELIQGDTFSLQFRGDKNVTEHIMFEVRDNVFAIENKNTALWTHPPFDPPLLVITAPYFYHIEVNETGSVTSRDTITSDKFGIIMGSKLGFADLTLDCELVYFWNASPSGGLITFKGQTKFLHIYNTNLMAVDARQMPCEYAIVENSSKGDVSVVVSTQFNYSITGTGNIYLYGNPAIIPGELTSSGKLIH